MFEIPVLTLKLLALSSIIAKRQSIHDRTASRNSWDQSYDFIIVGAGSSGCAIANRLSQNTSVTILLLEAGGAQSAINSDIPAIVEIITQKDPDIQFQYYSEPQVNTAMQYPGSRPYEPQGRVIGGSSAHNTMIYNRGNRRNYDEWAIKYGAKGWNYEEVLPFFKRWENNTDLTLVETNPKYHNTNGPVQVSTPKNPGPLLKLIQKTYNELGFENTDINGPNQTGAMIAQAYIDGNGIRSSAANSYLESHPIPSNLHIVAKALVVKILFNGLTAVGVEFSKNDKPFRVYARKEVILTAGVVNTPQLLMLSGIGIRKDLKRFGIPVLMNLPVGNNYFNHPQINIEVKIKNPDHFYPLPLLTLKSQTELFIEKGGLLSQFPLLTLYFSTKNNFPKDWPNQLLFTHISNDTLIFYLNYVRNRSPGTIRLQSTSPYVAPKIDPNILGDPLDRKDVIDAMKFVFYLIEKSSFAQYVTPPSFESIGCPVCPNKPLYECIEGIKCFIQYNTKTSYHPCCSCRMGAVYRDDVVVDPVLRVKNIKQLRICDSSVFSSKPNSNMNGPTLMVAEKCAQIIKDSYNIN